MGGLLKFYQRRSKCIRIKESLSVTLAVFFQSALFCESQSVAKQRLRCLGNFRIGDSFKVQEMERFIEFYFNLGLKYEDIRVALARRHNYIISLRHLKRILAEMGLNRRKEYSSVGELVEFIRNQLQYSGQLHGYRWMYAKCREHGLRVKRNDVWLVMRELNPTGGYMIDVY